MWQTRTSERWASKPGSFDALNTALIESGEDYPTVWATQLRNNFLTVTCNDYKAYKENSLVSTFVDDYYLERFWNDPLKYVDRMKAVAGVMTPDFSLYLDLPRPLLQYNVYRNRFVGSVWQRHGVNVIPTISWTDESSFDFCFEGVTHGSIVAVSNTGCKTEEQKAFFDAGFEEMKARINPKQILFQCHKRLRPLYLADNVVFLDSYFEKRRKQWAGE